MIKILVLSLLFVASIFASDIKWAKDYNDALSIAKKQNKPVLFVGSRHTCKYCVILDKTTFKDAKVVEALSRDYVSVISYSDENDYMPRELWRPGTPAIWFLLPNGEPMYEALMGAVGPEDFLKALDIVKTEFDKRQPKEENDFYKLKK